MGDESSLRIMKAALHRFQQALDSHLAPAVGGELSSSRDVSAIAEAAARFAGLSGSEFRKGRARPPARSAAIRTAPVEPALRLQVLRSLIPALRVSVRGVSVGEESSFYATLRLALLQLCSMDCQWLSAEQLNGIITASEYSMSAHSCTLPGIEALAGQLLEACWASCLSVQRLRQRAIVAVGEAAAWQGSRAAWSCAVNHMSAAVAMGTVERWLRRSKEWAAADRSGADLQRYEFILAAFLEMVEASLRLLQAGSTLDEAGQTLQLVKMLPMLLFILNIDEEEPERSRGGGHLSVIQAQLEGCTRLLETAASVCTSRGASPALLDTLSAADMGLRLVLRVVPLPQAALLRCERACKALADGGLGLPREVRDGVKETALMARANMANSMTRSMMTDFGAGSVSQMDAVLDDMMHFMGLSNPLGDLLGMRSPSSRLSGPADMAERLVSAHPAEAGATRGAAAAPAATERPETGAAPASGQGQAAAAPAKKASKRAKARAKQPASQGQAAQGAAPQPPPRSGPAQPPARPQPSNAGTPGNGVIAAALVRLQRTVEVQLPAASAGLVGSAQAMAAIAEEATRFHEMAGSLEDQPPAGPPEQVDSALRLACLRSLLPAMRLELDAAAVGSPLINQWFKYHAAVVLAAVCVCDMGTNWLVDGPARETNKLDVCEGRTFIQLTLISPWCSLPGIEGLAAELLASITQCLRIVGRCAARSEAATAGQPADGSDAAVLADIEAAGRYSARLNCVFGATLMHRWLRDTPEWASADTPQAARERSMLAVAAFTETLTHGLRSLQQPEGPAFHHFVNDHSGRAAALAELLYNYGSGYDPAVMHALLDSCCQLLELAAATLPAPGPDFPAFNDVFTHLQMAVLYSLDCTPLPPEALLARCAAACAPFTGGRYRLNKHMDTLAKLTVARLKSVSRQLRLQQQAGQAQDEQQQRSELTDGAASEETQQQAGQRDAAADGAVMQQASSSGQQDSSSAAAAAPVGAAGPQLSTQERRRLRQQRRRERNARHTAASGQQEELAAQLGSLAVGLEQRRIGRQAR